MTDWGEKFSHFEKILGKFSGLTLGAFAKQNDVGATTAGKTK
jgi:hypothetical protein